MSTTSCPCPHPPGGSVTCEGKQFAYCHVIGGEVRSGCIPNPRRSITPPTTETIVPLFQEVLRSAGFDDWLDDNFVYYAPTDWPPPWRFRLGRSDLPEFLEFAMKSGVAIALMIGPQRDYLRPKETHMLLIRFPSIWARHDASPEGAATTIG